MRLLPGVVLALVPFAVALAQTQTPAPLPTQLPALRAPVVQTPSAQAPVATPMPPLPKAATAQANPSTANPSTTNPATTNLAPANPPQAAPGTEGQAAPGAPPDAAAAPPPLAWLPVGVAEILALDKVTARATRLTVRVGQTANFGSLAITVRACDIRPPDIAADSTALLDITDSHAGAPDFHGWMLVSAPSVSMLEHPIYDIRLAGCHQ